MHLIDSLLEGSVDLHMHPGPDVPHEPQLVRRVDALQAAEMAKAVGQRAIALKSHQYSTAPLATIISRIVPGITLLGALALNRPTGGLNADAVALAAGLGARILWMPTVAARHHRRAIGASDDGIYILDGGGNLVPEVGPILDIVAQNDMVLATGHLTPEEGLALVPEARRRGVEHIIITHPSSKRFGGYTVEQMHAQAAQGAYIEFVFNPVLPAYGSERPEDLVAGIRAVGVERCIVTTDGGQISNPPPCESMRMAIATLLLRGFTADEVDLLVRQNPARVAGL